MVLKCLGREAEVLQDRLLQVGEAFKIDEKRDIATPQEAGRRCAFSLDVYDW